jgi:hypothetical protein
VLRDAQDITEESRLLDVNAEQLRQLVQHDHEPDAGLEAGQHRRGDEVRDEAEAQHGSQHQEHAHHRRERGRGSEQFRRIAVRHDQAELSAREDRQRRGGAHAEHSRRAEQRVEDHRDEGRVQADRDGQARHGCVGHRLRQDDRRRGQAGDDVETKRRFGRLHRGKSSRGSAHAAILSPRVMKALRWMLRSPHRGIATAVCTVRK